MPDDHCPDAWIILLTDPGASYGHYRVAVLGTNGRPTDSLKFAEIFSTREAAEDAIRKTAPQHWVATVALLHVNAVPAVPWMK